MTTQKQANDNPQTRPWDGDTVEWPKAGYGSVILIKGEKHSVAYLLADLVVVEAFELDTKQTAEFVMAAMTAWDNKSRNGSLSILTGIGGFPHPLPPILPPRIPKGISEYILALAANTTHIAAGQLNLTARSWLP